MTTSVILEILFIAVLLLANGIFAMTEIAVVSARKVRLRNMAENGHPGASAALALAEQPGQFLSTVQIGITLIGIIAGAFSGATLARQLAIILDPIPIIGAYAAQSAFLIVVAILTFFTLVIGELVPKRIGLLRPEALASFAAGPMSWFSMLMSPVVRVLGFSTDLILRLVGLSNIKETTVSEEEVAGLVHEGMRAGVILPSEGAMVESVLALDRIRVREIMTPRPRIVWLDADASHSEIWNRIVVSARSRFPVFDGSHDNVVGVASVKSIYANFAAGFPVQLRNLTREPLYVSELQSAVHLLEDLKRHRRQLAIVTDEFGSISGIVTLNDILEAIVGELPEPGRDEPARFVQREDGSWLVDGLVGLDELPPVIPGFALNPETDRRSETLAGFVCERIGRLPQEGDHFSIDGFRLEVVDMDRLRVDKILVSPTSPPNDRSE